MLIQHERRVMVTLWGGHLKCPWGEGQQISVAMTSDLRSLRLHDYWGMRGQHSCRVLTHKFSAGLHLFQRVWNVTCVVTGQDPTSTIARIEEILRKEVFRKYFMIHFCWFFLLIIWNVYYPLSLWLNFPKKSHLSITFQAHDGLMAPVPQKGTQVARPLHYQLVSAIWI